MADNYTQFSDALELDNVEQVAWFRKQLDGAMLDRLRNYELEHAGGKIRKPRWAKDSVLADHILAGSECGIDFEFIGPDAPGRYSIVFYNEESGDVDAVAVIVQAYLTKFAPKRCFGICWAATCNRPRIGEFGGGAIFVTAKGVEYINTFEWLDRKVAAFKKTASRRKQTLR
jgi:hypothetical protein